MAHDALAKQATKTVINLQKLESLSNEYHVQDNLACLIRWYYLYYVMVLRYGDMEEQSVLNAYN